MKIMWNFIRSTLFFILRIVVVIAGGFLGFAVVVFVLIKAVPYIITSYITLLWRYPSLTIFGSFILFCVGVLLIEKYVVD